MTHTRYPGQMTLEAQEYLVKQYRNLRIADASGVTKASYRITVRQLESMIRLSEALAKLFCDKEITLKHVKEAAHLLQTSIVAVDADDVEFEDIEAEGSQLVRPSEVGQAVLEDGMSSQAATSTAALGESMEVDAEVGAAGLQGCGVVECRLLCP